MHERRAYLCSRAADRTVQSAPPPALDSYLRVQGGGGRDAGGPGPRSTSRWWSGRRPRAAFRRHRWRLCGSGGCAGRCTRRPSCLSRIGRCSSAQCKRISAIPRRCCAAGRSCSRRYPACCDCCLCCDASESCSRRSCCRGTCCCHCSSCYPSVSYCRPCGCRACCWGRWGHASAGSRRRRCIADATSASLTSGPKLPFACSCDCGYSCQLQQRCSAAACSSWQRDTSSEDLLRACASSCSRWCCGQEYHCRRCCCRFARPCSRRRCGKERRCRRCCLPLLGQGHPGSGSPYPGRQRRTKTTPGQRLGSPGPAGWRRRGWGRGWRRLRPAQVTKGVTSGSRLYWSTVALK